MVERDELLGLLSCDPERFHARVNELEEGVYPERLDGREWADEFLPEDRPAVEGTLVRRARVLDGVQFGITVTGPAYQDNPIRYANRSFRELTGYSLETLRGENPRLLQGPETSPAAVEALREATSIWEPTTVTVRNYRRDGSAFDNRVSVRPVEDETGTITNWVGVHEAVK